MWRENMKYFNVRLLIYVLLLSCQLDSWITNGPTSEQKVEISFLLLHAINKSL